MNVQRRTNISERRLHNRQRAAAAAFAAWFCAAPLHGQTPAESPEAASSQPVRIEQSQGPVRVEVTLDSDHVDMTAPFKLRIHIEAERDVAVGTPDYQGILGTFEIVDQQSQPIDCDDLHECREIVMTLRAALPGEATIPPLVFAYSDARPKMDGSHNVIQDQFELDPIPIVVANSLADIKAPADIPIPLTYRLLIWTLVAVAALLAIALFVRWWLRRPRRIPMAHIVPQLQPYEWAMRELNRLIAEDLVAKGQTQEFFYRINLLLRQYIERRFNVMAGEQTSEEFIRSVQAMGALTPDQRETLHTFVSACDPVKYARQQPTSESIHWVHETAREFINATRQTSFVAQSPTSDHAAEAVK